MIEQYLKNLLGNADPNLLNVGNTEQAAATMEAPQGSNWMGKLKNLLGNPQFQDTMSNLGTAFGGGNQYRYVDYNGIKIPVKKTFGEKFGDFSTVNNQAMQGYRDANRLGGLYQNLGINIPVKNFRSSDELNNYVKLSNDTKEAQARANYYTAKGDDIGAAIFGGSKDPVLTSIAFRNPNAKTFEDLKPEDQQVYSDYMNKKSDPFSRFQQREDYQQNNKKELEGIQLENKKDLVNYNEGTPSSQRDKIKLETQIRNDYDSDPIVKNQKVINDWDNKVQTVYKSYTQSPDNKNRIALDQVLINALNKTLDPTSVVREGEYARSEQAQSLFNRLSGFLPRLQQGGASLTPADRQEIVNTLSQLKQGAEIETKATTDYYNSLADDYGIPRHRVTGRFDRTPQPIQRPTTRQPAKTAPKKKMSADELWDSL